MRWLLFIAVLFFASAPNNTGLFTGSRKDSFVIPMFTFFRIMTRLRIGEDVLCLTFNTASLIVGHRRRRRPVHRPP